MDVTGVIFDCNSVVLWVGGGGEGRISMVNLKIIVHTTILPQPSIFLRLVVCLLGGLQINCSDISVDINDRDENDPKPAIPKMEHNAAI